eukprot:SAG22_NODE_17421_length_305_cov_0.757282_1_plen_63_part_10
MPLQTETLERKLAESMKLSTVAAMLGDLIPEIDLSKIPGNVDAVLNPAPPAAAAAAAAPPDPR